MKLISELYKNVRDVNWYKNQFQSGKDKTNVLFVDPVMMNFDFYSMIIPYLALAEDEENFNTAITGLYRYSEIDTKPQTVITGAQIRWSDVVVMPNSLEPLNLLAEEIKEENPNCKFIQTMEFDFYEINNDHYLLEDSEIIPILEHRKMKVTAKNKNEIRKQLKTYIIDRLENNLRHADRIIVLNENLLEKLEQKGFKDVQYCPLVIDPDTFLENINYQDTLGTRLTDKMLIMSCELKEYTRTAFKEFIPQFEKIANKHGKSFKLVIMGDDPVDAGFPNLPFEYTHLPTGSIVSQFKRIWKSSADIHLMLNKKNIYSSNSMNLFSWIDRGMLGIPIASLSISPLNELIDHEKTGFLLKNRGDLVKLVDENMKSKTTLSEMSKSLKIFIREHCQLDDGKLDWLGKIFTDFSEEEISTDEIEIENE